MRSDTVPVIARLTRSRDYRTVFEAALGSRDQTIISALPDDTFGYVCTLLDDAGGSAVLDGVVHFAVLVPAPRARCVVAAEDDRVAEVHHGARVAMFPPCSGGVGHG